MTVVLDFRLPGSGFLQERFSDEQDAQLYAEAWHETLRRSGFPQGLPFHHIRRQSHAGDQTAICQLDARD